MNSFKGENSVSKLNGQNYQLWRFKLEMILYKEDLWDIVNGEILETRDSDWERKNRHAMASICLLIEDRQLVHVKELKTAKEMWDMLRKVHERTNLSSKLFLLRKLYRLRLQKDQNMRDHINEILEIIQQLKGIGEEIKENHTAAILLCSLPDAYENLITALEARSEQELTLNLVSTKLIDEYERRKESRLENNKETVKETVLNVDASKQNRKESRICFFCKKSGHLKKDCRKYQTWKSKPQHNANLAADQDKRCEVDLLILEKGDTKENLDEFCYTLKTKTDIKWFIDSGATAHMTNDRTFFSELNEDQNTKNVHLADGSTIKVEGIGQGYLMCKIDSDTTLKVNIKNVMYIPKLEGSLLSVKALTKEGYSVIFSDDKCSIKHEDTVLGVAKLDPHLYKLKCNKVNERTEKKCENCIHKWHRRLGHRNTEAIIDLQNNNKVKGLEVKNCNNGHFCEPCIKGKMSCKPYPKKSLSKTVKPFQLIHSDVCGPIKTPTIGGMKYILTFIDDYSRFTEIYLLKQKSEVEEKFDEYICKNYNKFQRKPEIFRTDGGGEYIGKGLEQKLKKQGIIHQKTIPYSPQQNGIAERKNRSLIEMAKCMLIDSNLSEEYWGEAVTTANYLQNRLPHSSLDKTPMELWENKIPDLSHIRVFGSKAFAYIPKEKRSKLDENAQEGQLMGYGENYKGYRIKLKNSNRIIMSRSVIFNEEKDEMININFGEKPNEVTTEITTDSFKGEEKYLENETEETELRRSSRINKGVPAKRLSYLSNLKDNFEPKSRQEIKDLHVDIKSKWMQAEMEEMESLASNNTWELTKMPAPDTNIMGCRWKLYSTSKQ